VRFFCLQLNKKMEVIDVTGCILFPQKQRHVI
jgi:hypothetical protein